MSGLDLNKIKLIHLPSFKSALMTIEKIIEEIKSRIAGYENTAEELIQELDNEEDANKYLAKADALNDLLKWIETK